MSAFTLFIDDSMIREIISYTETETRSKINKKYNWSTSREEIYAFLGFFLLEVSLPKGSKSMIYGPK